MKNKEKSIEAKSNNKFRIVEFLTDPEEFYNKINRKNKLIYIFIAAIAWCCGIGGVTLKITQDYTSAMMGISVFQGNLYAIQDWKFFWFITSIAGLILGIILYWIGGWWYNLRIRWSGDKNIDKRMGRKVFICNVLIKELPIVIVVTICTFVFKNYAETLAKLITMLMLFTIFDILSIANSYRNVISLFKVNRSTAAIFFLIPQLLFYMITFIINFI